MAFGIVPDGTKRVFRGDDKFVGRERSDEDDASVGFQCERIWGRGMRLERCPLDDGV